MHAYNKQYNFYVVHLSIKWTTSKHGARPSLCLTLSIFSTSFATSFRGMWSPSSASALPSSSTSMAPLPSVSISLKHSRSSTFCASVTRGLTRGLRPHTQVCGERASKPPPRQTTACPPLVCVGECARRTCANLTSPTKYQQIFTLSGSSRIPSATVSGAVLATCGGTVPAAREPAARTPSLGPAVPPVARRGVLTLPRFCSHFATPVYSCASRSTRSLYVCAGISLGIPKGRAWRTHACVEQEHAEALRPVCFALTHAFIHVHAYWRMLVARLSSKLVIPTAH
eukprot:365602-Chlamydomonas_euryale.AAC.10